MAEITIRPMEERDIPRAVEIETAILGPKRSMTLRGSLTAYLAKGERNASIVAEAEGKVVGFLVGDVRAWDMRTGKVAWTFHSVPRDGEKFNDTWAPGSWKNRSGVNVWGFLTVDVDRGIVYMPFGAPSNDRYGGDRPGVQLQRGDGFGGVQGMGDHGVAVAPHLAVVLLDGHGPLAFRQSM